MRKTITPRMKQVAHDLGLEGEVTVDVFRRKIARIITDHQNLDLAARALEIDVTTLSRWCSEKHLNIALSTRRTTIARTFAFIQE